jgi:carboxymethylenebutenolidase
MVDVHAGMIEFKSDSHTTPGYLTEPADAAEHPGVVIIQEWWGLVPQIKDVAERLAREGFIVLAPDLYHGKASTEPDEARKLAMALDRDRAVAEIDAAARFLAEMGRVRPKKVGTVGWCMGGGLALSTAASSKLVGATVSFYGRPLSEEDTGKIASPVLGLYGEKDRGIPLGALRDFEAALQKARVVHEMHVYPRAGHAFFNDTRPEAYNPSAAKDAWKRIISWLQANLVSRSEWQTAQVGL